MTARPPVPLLVFSILWALACTARRDVAVSLDEIRGGTLRLDSSASATVVEVTSPAGAGAASLRVPAGARLTVRLRLDHLEEFRVGCGARAVTLSIPASGGAPRERLMEGGAERALAPGDALWMAVRRTAGGFEVTVPSALLSCAGPLTLRWTNLYRQASAGTPRQPGTLLYSQSRKSAGSRSST